jgi:hypothetical protein
MRRRYFASSAGSIGETAAAIDLATALGLIDDTIAHDILALCVRARHMLQALR